MKWVWRSLAVVTALLILVPGGGLLWLRTSLPQISGKQSVAGIGASVRITRDSNGIPHIRAASMEDARFALGFVHAQDRLFQMEFTRLLGSGRLSEVVGDSTLGIDRAMRTLGLRGIAEANVASLSAGSRAALDAYTRGVNAYLDTHAGALPPEFYLLGHRPAPWRPADSLIWGRVMALRLAGNWHTEAFRAALVGRLGRRRIDQLWPRQDDGVPPTVTAGAALPGNVSPRLFAGLIEAFPDALDPITASNSWGVAGSQTGTGKPILANDPHLGFGAPVLWYLARIETPHGTLVGATVPGVPFTILGHNGAIAWSFTTNESDTQDLFVERIDPTDPDRYLTPDGSRPFAVRKEVIRVRGGDDVAITVRSTRHGPVISDIRPGLAEIAGDGHVVALAATALRKDDGTAEAMFRLNRARDWNDFRAALRYFHSPHQNVTYADRKGNLGFIAAARVPVRRSGRGLMPAPGWTGSHDWTGFIPFDALPHAFNPSSNRIVNANHRVVEDGYAYFLGETRTTSYRARRIHSLLDDTPVHTIETSAAMHSDSLSLMARDIAPRLTAITPSDSRAKAAVTMLRKWNGAMDRMRPEPLIFIAWLRELNRLLYADELGPLFHRFWRLRPIFVKSVLERHTGWCDDRGTGAVETCDQRIEAALVRALDDLARRHGDDPGAWRWGDAHYAKFRHPVLGRIPLLKSIADIELASDGGPFTVNRAQPHIGNASTPFASVHGPGYRAIYDLADLDNSRFMQATGQSGNPLSGHYSDLVGRWRDGDYLRIAGRGESSSEEAEGTLVLAPRR